MIKDNWKSQSSKKVNASGEVISVEDFDTKNWYPTEVPSTVLAALVSNGIYKNIFFGENLKSVPKDHIVHLITNLPQKVILPIQISSTRIMNAILCFGATNGGRSAGDFS